LAAYLQASGLDSTPVAALAEAPAAKKSSRKPAKGAKK
jgi:hypothetical protein